MNGIAIQRDLSVLIVHLLSIKVQRVTKKASSLLPFVTRGFECRSKKVLSHLYEIAP